MEHNLKDRRMPLILSDNEQNCLDNLSVTRHHEKGASPGSIDSTWGSNDRKWTPSLFWVVRWLKNYHFDHLNKDDTCRRNLDVRRMWRHYAFNGTTGQHSGTEARRNMHLGNDLLVFERKWAPPMGATVTDSLFIILTWNIINTLNRYA